MCFHISPLLREMFTSDICAYVVYKILDYSSFENNLNTLKLQSIIVNTKLQKVLCY